MLCADDLSSIKACGNERFEDLLHAMMEESIPSDLAYFIGETLQLRHRYVPKENCCARRDLTSGFLRNVPNRHVDRPSDLVASKLGEICLIRRKDDGNHGRADG